MNYDWQPQDIVGWNGKEYAFHEVQILNDHEHIMTMFELRDWGGGSIHPCLTETRINLLQVTPTLIYRTWYNYQVIQCYDQFGRFDPNSEWNIYAQSHWKKPFTTAEEAIAELDRCTFPGVVQRMANFRNGNSWTAGTVYEKLRKADGSPFNVKYWNARLESIGVVPVGRTLVEVRFGAYNSMILDDGSEHVIPQSIFKEMR